MALSLFDGKSRQEKCEYLSPKDLKYEDVVSSALDLDDVDEARNKLPFFTKPGDAKAGFEEPVETDKTEGQSSPVSDTAFPFSALTPSMRPSKEVCQDDETDNFEYDEFGFKIDTEGTAPEVDRASGRQVPFPVYDDPAQRLKWIAHLEFAQSASKVSSGPRKKALRCPRQQSAESGIEFVDWNATVEGISRTQKLRSMVRDGIPHSLRPYIWMRLGGAINKRTSSEVTYGQIVKASSGDHSMTSKQIEKDLLRTLTTNACFASRRSPGIPRLRRILRGLAWLYPDIGYCQGMGMVVATLLLLMEEEDAFWLTTALIEDLLPPSYYSPSLIGVQVDQMVLRGLVATCLPAVDTLLQEHDIEISLITLNWFLTVFAGVVHIRLLLRIWDLLLFDGSKVLFQVAIAMISLNEGRLLKTDNAADIFNILSTLPDSLTDVEVLAAMERPFFDNAITDSILDEKRRRHCSFLLSEQGAWHGTYGEQQRISHSGTRGAKLFKRTMKRSKSMADLMLFGNGAAKQMESMKAKNIRQTEIMIRLRDAILRVSRYFQAADPKHFQASATVLQADYSMDSHTKDHEAYPLTSRRKRKRARAIADFERKDDDELGFRKNDIVTIVSQRDEHCWVGELNGCTGWFPAKFVQLLDERSKRYCLAGDDSVSIAVTDLVRGCLCPSIKAVLEHGLLRRSPLLSGPIHPWIFIEEAASKEVERDFRSVYSRLMLCKTFRLNEDSKVLSPEELLYRCVEAVNFTHTPVNAQLDVKLRSLICLGLNEQVLHLWLEVLASNEEVIRKYYSVSSFLNSPGWVQIKCELRLLSKFSFNLNPDWELAGLLKQQPNQSASVASTPETTSLAFYDICIGAPKPTQEGVRDMLVKHHLFSWDL